MARLPKKERTRQQLLEAGLTVVAELGSGLTATAVVEAADVSNGTFYNHFAGRTEFLEALANDTFTTLIDASAEATEGHDAPWRFAVAVTQVLSTAADRPVWGRAVLRLADCEPSIAAAMQRHLRNDLADGHQSGNFTHGADPITVDMVSGCLLAAVRRLSSGRGGFDQPAYIADMIARLLGTLGVPDAEAADLAQRALAAQADPPST